MPVFLKEFLNNFFNPTVYVVSSCVLFVAMLMTYRIWTRPRVAAALFGVMILFFLASFTDPNFRKIVTKEDNVPIVALVFILAFFLWLSLRQAAVNDELIEKGEP